MHTFTLQIKFSAEVLNDAAEIAEVHGKEHGHHYLEKLLEDALEGGHFEDVTATVVES